MKSTKKKITRHTKSVSCFIFPKLFFFSWYIRRHSHLSRPLHRSLAICGMLATWSHGLLSMAGEQSSLAQSRWRLYLGQKVMRYQLSEMPFANGPLLSVKPFSVMPFTTRLTTTHCITYKYKYPCYFFLLLPSCISNGKKLSRKIA